MIKNAFLLTIVLIFAFSNDSSAQYSYRKSQWTSNWDGALRKGLHIGVVGSFNSSWIFNQNNYNTLNLFNEPIVRQSEMDYVFTWGGNIGIELGYQFHKNWGIQIEPSFSWAGQKYDDDFLGPVAKNDPTNPNYVGVTRYVNVRRIVKLQYVQIPLMLKYQCRLDERTNFFVMAGPQIGIRTSGTETVYVNNVESVDAKKYTPDQKFQKIDAGLLLNLGLDVYPKEWLVISVGLPTYIGLTDLNGKFLKTIDWYSKNDLTYQKSRNFRIGLQAGVHYFFNRGNAY